MATGNYAEKVMMGGKILAAVNYTEDQGVFCYWIRKGTKWELFGSIPIPVWFARIQVEGLRAA